MPERGRSPAEHPPLNRALLRSPAFTAAPDLKVPAAVFDAPEKALQFGSGAFLRGFVEPFLDDANQRGTFGGRVVVVESTGQGRSQTLVKQDGLYTLLTRGGGAASDGEERRIIAVVGRAISAPGRWTDVLACARNPDLELIFSNTTEVGISLDDTDAPALDPPRSFPGKLTRFLYERGRAFHYARESGVVVIPCELIEDNGDRLREIVLALGERWDLGRAFSHWVQEAVPFCNTLVDRIVPGAPDAAEVAQLEAELGYRDELLTLCETYRLFVIQANDEIRARLSFAHDEPDILLVDDVRPYRQRKVRLLNGAHTLLAPVGLLAGCETVCQASQDDLVGGFLRRLMLQELVPSMDVPGANEFAHDVLTRFANPLIRHELLGITLHGTMKMRTRVVPSILRAATAARPVRSSLALGFACHLLFMRGDWQAERRSSGRPVPHDDAADRFRDLWAGVDARDPAEASDLAHAVGADVSLWGTDLTAVPGFCRSVAAHLLHASREGVPAALQAHLAS